MWHVLLTTLALLQDGVGMGFGKEVSQINELSLLHCSSSVLSCLGQVGC